MKLKLIHILPVIALLFLDGSCKPEDEYNYLQSRELAIFDHGVGSWWEYQNDSTNIFDTITLTQVWHDFSDATDPGQKRRTFNEEIYLKSNSKYFAGNVFQQIRNNGKCNSGYISFPGAEGANHYIGYHDIDCNLPGVSVNFYDQLSINGNLYQDIFEITNNDFAAWGNDTAKFYFVENIGIVKWFLVNTDTCWSLSNYQIF